MHYSANTAAWCPPPHDTNPPPCCHGGVNNSPELSCSDSFSLRPRLKCGFSFPDISVMFSSRRLKREIPAPISHRRYRGGFAGASLQPPGAKYVASFQFLSPFPNRQAPRRPRRRRISRLYSAFNSTSPTLVSAQIRRSSESCTPRYRRQRNGHGAAHQLQIAILSGFQRICNLRNCTLPYLTEGATQEAKEQRG